MADRLRRRLLSVLGVAPPRLLHHGWPGCDVTLLILCCVGPGALDDQVVLMEVGHIDR